jgi:hypothetical protein
LKLVKSCKPVCSGFEASIFNMLTFIFRRKRDGGAKVEASYIINPAEGCMWRLNNYESYSRIPKSDKTIGAIPTVRIQGLTHIKGVI